MNTRLAPGMEETMDPASLAGTFGTHLEDSTQECCVNIFTGTEYMLGILKIIYSSQISGLFLHLAPRNITNTVPVWQKYKAF